MNNFFNLRLVINDMVLYLIKNILNGQIVLVKKNKNKITEAINKMNFVINTSYSSDTIKTISPRILETELFNLNEWILDVDRAIKGILTFLKNIGTMDATVDVRTLRKTIYANIEELNKVISSRDLRVKERQQIEENRGKRRYSVFFYNDFLDYIKDCKEDISISMNNINLLLFNLNTFVDNFDHIKSTIRELKQNNVVSNSDLKALEKMTIKINLVTKNNFLLINRNINRNITNINFIMDKYKEVVENANS